MKVNNIKRAIEHVKSIKPESFSMRTYRNTYNLKSIECGSVGCIVGHCTILDGENVKNNFTDSFCINFTEWSYNYFGLLHGNVWDYMFSCLWSYNPDFNTIEHAIYRMQRIVDGYEPKEIEKEVGFE